MAANERQVLFESPLDASVDLPPSGAGFAAELRAMQDRAFCESEKYKDQQHRASRDGALEALLEVERKAVKRFKKLGVPMFAHCVIRTAAEQVRMFNNGVSNAQAGQSPHQYGLAFDLIHGTKGWQLTQRQWLLVKHIVFEVAASCGVKLRWGGDWDGDGDIHDQKLYDPAHFEILDWRDIGTKR